MIIMLPGMNEDFSRILSNGFAHRSRLDELRSCADNCHYLFISGQIRLPSLYDHDTLPIESYFRLDHHFPGNMADCADFMTQTVLYQSLKAGRQSPRVHKIKRTYLHG